MAERIEQSIEIENHQIINEIFGDLDNIEIIKELNIDVKVNNNEIQIFKNPGL